MMMSYDQPPSPPIIYVVPEAAPDDGFQGPEFKQFTAARRQNKVIKKNKPDNTVVCTACGNQVTFLRRKDDVFAHPALCVVICRKCNQFYHSGGFTQDEEGSDEQCKWCGEGGNLICCNFCPAAFCNYCIKRNFSQKQFREFRDLDEWHCFCCDRTSLKSKVRECKVLLKLQAQHFSKKNDDAINNGTAEMFSNLTANNRRIDDLIAPMETDSNAGKDGCNDQSSTQAGKKVNPITILREKEQYTIRSRSRSPDSAQTQPKRDLMRSQSDPESTLSPHAALGKRNTDVKKEVGQCYGETVTTMEPLIKKKAASPKTLEKSAGVSKPTAVLTDTPQVDVSDTESSMEGSKMSSETNFSELTITSMDSMDDEDESYQEDILGENSDQDENIRDEDSGNNASPMYNFGGELPEQDVQATVADPPEAVKTPPTEEVFVYVADAGPATATAQPNNVPETYKEILHKAESCVSDLTAIFDQLGQMNSRENASQPSASTKSPTQFCRFRSTTKILKEVRRLQSKLQQVESNLKTQKHQLGKYRPSYGATSDLSSDEEQVSQSRGKDVPEQSQDAPSPVAETALASGEFEAAPGENEKVEIDGISTETLKLHDAHVVLKRLTETEIRKLCQNSEYVGVANDDDDSDSSKAAFRPGSNDEGSASSDLEDFESRIEKELNGIVSEDDDQEGTRQRSKVKMGAKLNKQKHKTRIVESDDETDFSDEVILSDEDTTLDFSSPVKSTGKVDNNEMAMNVLFEKMEGMAQDEPDSDIDMLLEESDKNVEKSDKTLKDETIGQNGDDAEDEDALLSSGGETANKKEKLATHPLLKEKWELDEESHDNVETRRTKRKRSDSEAKAESKNTRRKLKLGEGSDRPASDPDLTTDSDEDFKVSQSRKKEEKRKRRVVISDSDSDPPVNSAKSSDEAIKIDSSGNDAESDEDPRCKKTIPPKKRQRLVQWDTDDIKIKKEQPSNDDSSDMEGSSQKRSGRRNIRKILDDDELSHSTKLASQQEYIRRQRVERERSWEEENEEVIVIDDESQTPAKKLVTSRLILSKTPLVEVHRELVKVSKPHQLEGIRFMWDNLIEKVNTANTKPGDGCILAHCMGLGKTFQVVTFLNTILMSKHLPKLKTALILCPFGTINNWVYEFRKWLDKCGVASGSDFKFRRLPIAELHSARSVQERCQRLQRWNANGGVMVMGYGLYRTTMSTKKRLSSTIRTTLNECLSSPGPDVVICDEGHILKNAMSSIANLVQLLKTKRRVVLTGTPLQNNMVEYHCMVSFVKPRLLGTLKEFKNRFMNPIENGQHVDSTERDVKLMKKRAHVLHELLAGCVQRKDYSCLRSHLPAKNEYVLNVRLSDLQIRMYRHYLTRHSSEDVKLKQGCLFKDFNTLLLLVCHPRCLALQKKRDEKKALLATEQRDLNDFVATNDEEESEGESSDDSTVLISDEDPDQMSQPKPTTEEDLHGMSSRKLITFIESKRREKVTTTNRKKLVNLATKYLDKNFHKTPEFVQSLRDKSVQQLKDMIRENNGSIVGCTEKSDLVNKIISLVSVETEEREWFEELMPAQENLLRSSTHSGKITLMLEILRGATTVGDKVVIFSQSLLTLDLIEDVLKAETQDVCKGLVHKIEPYSEWHKNHDYFRLDGSTPGNLRDRWIKRFNNPKNARGRVFLISTRAGGIGINLIGANRAIVFDASWNPSHDIQSIFRIYRFGQTKVCFVYRFIAQGTMEEKIYERQVVKQSLAFRVVDEQQIVRHFSAADIAELYTFKPAPKPVRKRDESGQEIPEETPSCAPPRDTILAGIIKTVATRDMIVSYHEHDSLLDHQVSEELTEAERKAAWEEYDIERTKNEPPSQDNILAKLTAPQLMEIQKMADGLLVAIEQKLTENKFKSLSDIAVEIRMKNRATDTDTLSKLAIQRQLNQHILHRRLIRLKKYTTKKKDAAQRYYTMRLATLPQNTSGVRMPTGAAPLRAPPVLHPPPVHPQTSMPGSTGFPSWRPYHPPMQNPFARMARPPGTGMRYTYTKLHKPPAQPRNSHQQPYTVPTRQADRFRAPNHTGNVRYPNR